MESVPGVYISYPFCAQKCAFCNFASGVFGRELESKYRESLRREMRRHAWAWRPETVYLGGGTPSRLTPEELDAILSATPGRPWLEATMEAAPGTITAEKARAWRRSGIDRVSLGVQSFVLLEIARTGRKHTPALVEAEVRLLRAAGIDNINVDLIAGLSGQTEAGWRESLDWVERLAPEHVSVYMLEVDEDSRLGREILRGGARYGAADTPPEELTADLYEIAVDRLARMGIPRYEISNFARPGMESRHNLKYWRLEPYVGFGSDAHSCDGAVRRQNVESPLEYVGREDPCVESAPARPEEEKFFVGLRLSEGIRPAPGDWRRFEEPIHRFLDAGLLETRNGVLRLTNRGVMLSNEVFQEFVTA